MIIDARNRFVDRRIQHAIKLLARATGEARTRITGKIRRLRELQAAIRGGRWPLGGKLEV